MTTAVTTTTRFHVCVIDKISYFKLKEIKSSKAISVLKEPLQPGYKVDFEITKDYNLTIVYDNGQEFEFGWRSNDPNCYQSTKCSEIALQKYNEIKNAFRDGIKLVEIEYK